MVKSRTGQSPVIMGEALNQEWQSGGGLAAAWRRSGGGLAAVGRRPPTLIDRAAAPCRVRPETGR